MKYIIFPLVFFALVSCNHPQKKQSKEKKHDTTDTIKKPNIIILYADDLGYSDVNCYNKNGINTPNIDSLAANGIKFTDAHSEASTCTPSRYSLLTGNYAFRRKAAILPGDAPLLIDTTKVTFPRMLQNAGYTTGIVGKWHLGLGYGKVDWNKKITPGPNEVGFDYSYIIPATLDRVPTVFIENGKVVNQSNDDPIEVSYKHKVGNRPTGLEHPEMLLYTADKQHSQTIINHVSRIGYMGGGKDAEWVDEDFPFIFTGKVKDFMVKNRNKPFFLEYALTDPHVPRVPNKMFRGKSGMGYRGDAIVQLDYMVGQVMQQLKRLKIAKNTIVILTSDNGPILDDGYNDKAVQMAGDFNPATPFRGAKYSIYEGGTRMPTILSWPGTVQPKESDALLNQVDLYASFASFLGQDLSDDVIDSQDHMDAWLGKTYQGRKLMLEEGFTLGLRDGKWKYVAPFKGKSIPDWMANKDVEPGLKPTPQLFNLANDLKEQKNLAKEKPALVKKYQNKIDEIKSKNKKNLKSSTAG